MIFPALQNLCKPLPPPFLAFFNATSWKWKNITPGFIFLKIYLPHFNCKLFFEGLEDAASAIKESRVLEKHFLKYSTK